MISDAQALRHSGTLLEQRLRAAFEGNGLDQGDVRLERDQACWVPVHLRVELQLGWESSWSTETGYFHPAGAVHCSDMFELNNQLRNTLDARIADVDEARSLAAKWVHDGTGLLVWDKPSFQVRALENKWYCHEQCDTCRGRGETRCSCLYGRQDCGSCCGTGTFTSYSSTGAPPKVFNCGGCWGSGKVNCYSCGGTCWLSCRNCGAQGGFTTTKQAVITATLSKAVADLGSGAEGFVNAIRALPIETLAEQGDVALTNSGAGAGKAILDYELSVPYLCHGYALGGGGFEVHAIGKDLLVPLMPPVLDDVIGPVAARIVDDAASPAEVLRAAEGCRVTREILLTVGTQDKFDTGKIAGAFHDTVSVEMVSRISGAIATAYDRCAAGVVRRIWVKSVIPLNVAVVIAVMLGAFNRLARSLTASDPIATGHLLVFAAVLLALFSTWLIARQAALKQVRQVAGDHLTRPPSQGWLPKALGAATILVAILLVQHDNRAGMSMALASKGSPGIQVGRP